MPPAELSCFDGVVMPTAEAVISVTDEAFLRGDGVFELVRVYGGTPFAFAEHLDRLEHSARNLRLELPVERAALEDEGNKLLDARGGSAFDGCLRIVLTRGGRRLLMTEPLPRGPQHLRLGFVTYAPSLLLDGVKSLSYAANMLAGRLARERGFDEALFVTPEGKVLEAPTSSLFWVDQDGVLATPPLEDHILASITRERVMRLAEVTERQLSTEQLLDAKEAFLASTTREVQPVAVIEGRDFAADGASVPGPRTSEAAAAFREHVESVLGDARLGDTR